MLLIICVYFIAQWERVASIDFHFFSEESKKKVERWHFLWATFGEIVVRKMLCFAISSCLYDWLEALLGAPPLWKESKAPVPLDFSHCTEQGPRVEGIRGTRICVLATWGAKRRHVHVVPKNALKYFSLIANIWQWGNSQKTLYFSHLLKIRSVTPSLPS